MNQADDLMIAYVIAIAMMLYVVGRVLGPKGTGKLVRKLLRWVWRNSVKLISWTLRLLWKGSQRLFRRRQPQAPNP